MNSQINKQNISSNSDFLSQSEIDSLIQDMKEAEILISEMIRNDPNYPKIISLMQTLHKYPKGSIKSTEILREVQILQKNMFRNPSENPTK